MKVTREDESVDTLASETRDSINNSPYANMVNETKTEISGQHAVILIYESGFCTVKTYIGNGNKVYCVECGGLVNTSNLEKVYKDYFDPMINSFKIL